jgi:hypothetical protein
MGCCCCPQEKKSEEKKDKPKPDYLLLFAIAGGIGILSLMQLDLSSRRIIVISNPSIQRTELPPSRTGGVLKVNFSPAEAPDPKK